MNEKVKGLIGALGSWGCSDGQEWDLGFHLAAWKTGAGPVEQGSLRCLMRMDREVASVWSKKLPAYSLVELDIAERLAPGVVRLRAVQPLAEEPELEVVRDALQQPVRLVDDRLGVLELERACDTFEGRLSWVGQEVGLRLSCEDVTAPQAAMATAHALLDAQADWHRRVREYAIDRLLPLKNEHWLEEDEAALTREDFAARMTLKSICVDGDGGFEFWHDDGDLFYGHAIEIRGSLVDGLTDADIPG